MNWFKRFGAARGALRIGPVSDHAERLAEIHAGAFARPWGADEFETFLADRAIRIDGLFVGRARLPAGFAVSRLVLDEAEILSVALARPFRGHGHSRTLLAYHLQALAHAGIARVHLEVEEGNLPALALYRRLGFRQSGVRPGYYARPDGTRASAMSMTKIVSGPALGPSP
ncbi:GNAT family N-acetyltransferase [uncultured Enterovirga sp.]|uniref:GNAT family N-acetyltransferase n=1 Tax=uncultured Enterovirga sp. TaxID=2026352 RepID=UPI0035CB03A2